ncbi:unnamed protein product [Effrenium voratum]|nr:unnamed protein product [Effrenium voratum]
MASLCASVREQRLMDTCSGEASAGTYYKTFAKRRPRLVPLIGLDLATSSAVRSAATAASEHLEEMAQIHSAISGRAETSEDSGQELVEVTKKERSRKSSQADAKPTPCFANGTFGASRASKSRSRGPQLRQCSAPGPDQAFSLRQSWTTLIQKGAVPTTVAENDLEDPGAFQRSPRSNTSLGIGFLTHIAVSMVCLMPFLHTQATPHSCLLLPTLYMGYVVGLWLRFGPCAKSERVPVVMTKVLRMERLVSEGSLPVWFPHLAAAAYVVMVGMLELGHRFQTVSKSQRMLSAGPVRHDYNCWGTGQEDVADCILVRHAGCTMTVSFYTCLIVMKVCNRKVKGSDLVGEHERSLQQLFPLEAPSLLSYVERSVKSNSTFWRSHRHYKAQSLILSLAWTLMSFYVYTELLQGAKTKSAQAVFCTALVFTFMLQYTLLRHVLLRVIVILEGVKARAAAMAFCDEEGVLPFTSAHSVYVWFSVRRNVQAQNEVAYQNASPVFTAMLICAAVCSGWVISQLRQRGMSVFGLTSRGGASLMVVASALVSCIFVGVFLRTLLEIGKLEDAHVRQLRMAHLRLEHAKCLKKASAMETETGAFVERRRSESRAICLPRGGTSMTWTVP